MNVNSKIENSTYQALTEWTGSSMNCRYITTKDAIIKRPFIMQRRLNGKKQ